MKDYPAFAVWSNNTKQPFLNQISDQTLSMCEALQTVDGSQVLLLENVKARVMRKSHEGYTALALSTDPDRVKSKRLLEVDVYAMLSAAPIISATIDRAESRVRRLLHNLKSLTAKMSHKRFMKLPFRID